jgi:hypothetical protein
MLAYWAVLSTAALTALVAAAVGAALAVFAGQALPLAVRHDLVMAPGTALTVSGPVSGGQPTVTAGQVRAALGNALDGVPFSFESATWSDPMGLVPGKLPTSHTGTPKDDTPILQAASLTGITSQAVLVSGTWPAGVSGTATASAATSAPTATPAPAGTPIPAALPAAAAALLHVAPGDLLTVEDQVTNKKDTFRITGLFARRQASGDAGSYWSLSSIPASGLSTASGFTTYGPLVVAPAELSGANTPLGNNVGNWVAQPDMSRFGSAILPVVAANVSALPTQFQNSATLSSMQLATGLGSVLAAAASNLAVARSLLVIAALQLLVLAGAALLAAGRMLAGQREGETALLSARGASRWQFLGLTATEVVPLCVAATAAGVLAGLRLAALLTTIGPLKAAGMLLPGPAFLGGAGGAGSPADTWLDAIGAAAVVLVVAIAAILLPVLRTGPGMTRARARRGRQAVVFGVITAGADLALIVLAVLACWQLRHYSAGTGDTTIDPVLALAPALALAGGTVVTLRLLPAATRAADRLAGRGRGLTLPLSGWQLSRQPLRQSGPALLLVMAVATGTLALAQHASWARSAGDQAAFAAGADVRVDTPVPLTPSATGQIVTAPGVRHSMAVYSQSQATPTQVLAINANQAADTVLARSDQVEMSETKLFSLITPEQVPGTVLQGRPSAISFTAALTPAPGRAIAKEPGAIAKELGPVTITVTVADATGDLYQLNAGVMTADGRDHTLTASVGGTHASYPLRLVQIGASYQMPETAAASANLALTVTGMPLSGWQANATSLDLQAYDNGGSRPGTSLPGSETWHASEDAARFTFSSGFGEEGPPVFRIPQPFAAQVTLSAPAPNDTAPLPAIVTSAYADANGLGPGAVVPVVVNGAQVNLSIAAVVPSFPTVTDSTGALIVDLSALQERLVSQGTAPVSVTEWWLATADGQVPPGLAGTLPPGSAVTGVAAQTSALTGDPLSAVPQQALLALAAATALLAITGFWVSIAADVRRRSAENALLAALGVTQRSAALQLFLEKLFLSVPAAVAGVILGTVVAWLLVPAVTLSAAATTPVPPPLTLFDLPQTLALAAAIAIIPAIATALVLVKRPDPAAQLRTAEAA